MPVDEIQSQDLPLQPLGGIQQAPQQQLRPLTDTTPLPASTPFGSEGDTVGSLRAEAKNSADNFAVSNETQKLLQDYAEKGDSSISTGHYVLATLAALNGQFGPALAIQDQKRKTAFAQKISPIINQVNNLKNRGMIDEAADLLNTAAAQAGAKSPELLPLIQKQLEHISQKQVEKENNKTKANALSIFIAGMQPGDPRIAQGKSYIKLLLQPTPVAKETIAAIDKSLEDHTQIFNINNQLVTGRVNQSTGITTQQVGSAIPGSGDLTPAVLQRVSQELGWTAANIADVRGGKDTLVDGKLLKTTPQIQQELSDVITSMQKINTGQEEAKASAPTAEVAAQLRRVLQEEGQSESVSRLNVSLGNYKPEHTVKANKYVAEQSVASTQFDKSKLDSSGLSAISSDPSKLGVVTRGLSYDEAKKAGLHIVPNATTDKVQQAVNAVNGLNYIKQMYTDLTGQKLDGDADYKRLGVGLARFVQSYLGLAPDRQMTVANASRAIADRAINELENTQTVDDASIKELRLGLTGAWAEPEGPARAVELLQQRAKEKIGVWIGSQGITVPRSQQSSQQDDLTTTSAIHRAIIEGATQRGLDPVRALSMFRQESNYDPKAVNKDGGDSGLGQITEKTAKARGLDWNRVKTDTRYNLNESLNYLLDLKKKYNGDEDKALGSYNGAGESYVRDVARWHKASNDIIAASRLAPIVAPPSARSTPAQDAAYREQQQSAQQQRPGITRGTGR